MTSDQITLERLRRENAALTHRIQTLETELEGEKRQRRLLYDISRTLELERLLFMLSEEIDRLDLLDGYMINFMDAQRQGLLCHQVKMPAELAGLNDIYRNFAFPLEPGDANSDAFHSGRPVYLDRDSLARHQGLTRAAFERWNAASLVVIPIPYADGAIGTVIAFRRDGMIDPETVEAFERRLLLFNEQIRNALIFNSLRQSEQEVQSALEEHRKFLEFVSQVNRLTSPEQIYEAITLEFLEAFHFGIGCMTLTEPDGSLLIRHIAGAGPELEPMAAQLRATLDPSIPADRSAGATAIAFLQNTPIHIPDAAPLRNIPMAAMDRAAVDALTELRTVLHMPIRQHGRPIGVMSMFSLVEPRVISAGELRIIELLASFVGTAISNAQLYSVIGNQKGQIEELNRELQQKIQALDEMVRRDQLTGLHNFGAFKSELTRRTAEAKRQASRDGLALVVIDVDHFKHFNDTHGHLAGNVVLQEVASRIEQCARTMDIPCRFGGEEFVVILPKCDLQGAVVVGERIRRSVADTPFHVDDQLLPVTVSVGCTQYQPGEEMDHFVERADVALYRAKQNGRNRVEAERCPARNRTGT